MRHCVTGVAVSGLSMNVDADCLEMVSIAEDMFLGRWRLSSLAAVDPELYERLKEQRTLFDVALFGSEPRETQSQAEATVRGWKAACALMDGLSAPDDAFQYGTDPTTGTVVAIGIRPPSDGRLQLKKGQRVIFVTPDEVAKLVAGAGLLASIKHAFPDAEILNVKG
jgi:hypothetical protein